MANNSLDFLKDVLAVPLGELISSIGEGVGEAQAALDAGSLAQTLEIYSEDDPDNPDENLRQLREIGYQPTFYTLPETEVEATISIALSGTKQGITGELPIKPEDALTRKVVGRTRVYTSPFNAANANRYNMNVNAATKLKFKIVPVPPSDSVADLRVIPNLVGLTEEEAATLLAEFKLDYEVIEDTETGSIITQSPEAGTVGKIDDVIQLTL